MRATKRVALSNLAIRAYSRDMAPYLIVKTGTTLAPLIPSHGDFESWIASFMEVDATAVTTIEVQRHAKLPDPQTLTGRVRGVIVTGSAAMVTERAPWSVATGMWLEQVHARRIPIFGICYGHQLLADHLGGQVARNPSGRQIGTVELSLTQEGQVDPLFAAVQGAAPLLVQATHVEAVTKLPREAVRLATSPLDANHAFRIGDTTWGVQFHPEFSESVSAGYVEGRREAIEDEGLDYAKIRSGVRDTGHGRALLAAFRAFADAHFKAHDPSHGGPSGD